MRTFIKLHVKGNGPEMIPIITDAIKGTVTDVSTVDGDVFVWTEDKRDLMHKSISLGILNNVLAQKYHLMNPFMWDLVIMEDH